MKLSGSETKGEGGKEKLDLLSWGNWEQRDKVDVQVYILFQTLDCFCTRTYVVE